nr:MAG TPA: hypothetical protein [Caudoviricetes sp.]
MTLQRYNYFSYKTNIFITVLVILLLKFVLYCFSVSYT